jgi:hypothetical protein
VFQTWIDGVGYTEPVEFPGNGSGALIGHDPLLGDIMEKTIVHSGSQSAPLYYNNSVAPFMSEINRTFDVPQDWTKHGIKTLTLYFYGDPTNTSGALYVKINGKRVDSTLDLTRTIWMQWNIELASLGVNLINVTEMVIGISGQGSGLVYVDDIRLYRLAP